MQEIILKTSKKEMTLIHLTNLEQNVNIFLYN